MRAAHEAQVMPPISSSTGVFMAGGRGRPAASATGHLVTRFLHGGADGGLVDRRLAGDGQAAAGEVDVDGGDAGDLRDLLGHGVDAVAAGHADDGVGGAAHGVLSRKWDNGRERRSGADRQKRTRRAMASEASRTFSSAWGPPALAASTTQWLRCSSSSPSETACSSLVIAETGVRMSMQYFSSSTIRCRPRAWPSMRRSRLRYWSLRWM